MHLRSSPHNGRSRPRRHVQTLQCPGNVWHERNPRSKFIRIGNQVSFCGGFHPGSVTSAFRYSNAYELKDLFGIRRIEGLFGIRRFKVSTQRHLKRAQKCLNKILVTPYPYFQICIFINLCYDLWSSLLPSRGQHGSPIRHPFLISFPSLLRISLIDHDLTPSIPPSLRPPHLFLSQPTPSPSSLNPSPSHRPHGSTSHPTTRRTPPLTSLTLTFPSLITRPRNKPIRQLIRPRRFRAHEMRSITRRGVKNIFFAAGRPTMFFI